MSDDSDDPISGITPGDRDIGIRTIIGEGASEPFEGQRAIANVMFNRLRSGRYGSSLGALAADPSQFNAWMPQKMAATGIATIPVNSPVYQTAAAAFDSARAGAPDPTGGAINYYAPGLQAIESPNNPVPDFARGRQPTAIIGGHQFFNPDQAALGYAQNPVKKNIPADDAIDTLLSGGQPVSSAAPSAKTSANPAKSSLPSDADMDKFLSGGVVPPPVKTEVPGSGIVAPKAPVAPTAAQSANAAPVGPAIVQPTPTDASRALAGIPDGYLGSAERFGVGGLKGVQDVGNTVAQGIAAAGSYGANKLADYGVISPESAQGVQDWRSGVNARIGAGNQAFDANAGTAANIGRIGGQIAATAPILGPIGEIGEGTGIVANALRGAGMGGGSAALTSSTSDQSLGEQVGMGAVTGGVAGAVLPKLANGIMSPFRGGADPETALLAQRAQQLGIPVYGGQISSSPFVKGTNSFLQRMPLTGYGDVNEAIQTGVNRAITHTIGEDADKVTPTVMNAAKTRIGNMFQTAAANTSIDANDPQFGQSLMDVITDAARRGASQDEIRALTSHFDDIVNQIGPNGQITGDAYQSLTRTGTALDRAEGSQNSNISYYAGKLRDVLDDGLQRNAPPDMQNMLTDARRQWFNLKTVEPLVAKAPTGDVNPNLLMTRVNAQTGNGIAYGRGGDLADIARIGNKFIKQTPTSNTAENLFRGNALGIGAKIGLGIAGATSAAPYLAPIIGNMGPLEAAGGAAALAGAATVGRGVGSFLRSKTYTNSLINRGLANNAPGPIDNLLTGVARYAPLAAPAFNNRFGNPALPAPE